MLTSVELFAGAGGLGMGLSLAGFRHVAVVEWNRWACETIRCNQALGHELVAGWKLHEGDVRDTDYDSIREPIDVVAGGPPCQPFSLGGKHRAYDDTRDMFPAMAEVVRRLRPRAFIVENVKGLTRPGFAEYFDYVVARLALPEIVRSPGEVWTEHARRLRRHMTLGRRNGLTYDVSFRVLNAADYGVPQNRERVFIVGFRDDLGLGRGAYCPDPACSNHVSPRLDGEGDGAFWSFPTPTHSHEALLADQWVTGGYWERHRIGRPFRAGGSGGSHLAATRLQDRGGIRREPWRTVRDALAGLPDPEYEPAGAWLVPDHRFQPGVKFYAGHTGSLLDLPAKTLKAGDHGVPGGENALVRPDGSGRYFTVRESARLQTFPDTYVFGGSWSQAMRQLGNAVPVVLARAVGLAVARTLAACDAATSRRTAALV